MRHLIALLAGALLAVFATSLTAQDNQPRPTFERDGTVNVPSFHQPVSPLSSKEAQTGQAGRARVPASAGLVMEADVASARARLDRQMASTVAATLANYPVDIEDGMIPGVIADFFRANLK